MRYLKSFKESQSITLPFKMMPISSIDDVCLYYEAVYPDGDIIEVRFCALDGDMFENCGYDCVFYVNRESRIVTNKHKPYTTVSTVVAIINDFIKKVQPAYIEYETINKDDGSINQRDILYDRIINSDLDSDYILKSSGKNGGTIFKKVQPTKRVKWSEYEKYISTEVDELY